MSKNRFVLNRKGVREPLKSEEIAGECMERAKRMAESAGDGYAVEVRNYPERTGAAVYPGDDTAFYDNLAHNTLEKVIRQ